MSISSAKKRIVFAGTPEFAAEHLQALISSEQYEIVAVYSQPDRPAGRGKKLQASAVKQLALAHQLPVYQPESFKDAAAVSELASLNSDLMVVVAYGLLLPLEVLNTPKLACINVHGSLLPRWRGAAPIQRAIWAGDKKTGIAIMQMDEGLDTGDVIHQIACDISEDETSASLYHKLAQLGPKALLEAMEQIFSATAVATAQDETHSNYAKKLSKAEALIDWQLEARSIERHVRAFNPWPVSYFAFEGGNYKVWQSQVIDSNSQAQPGTIVNAGKEGLDVATSEGLLRITQLQIPGKKAMPIADILNSKKDLFKVGKVLVAQ